MKENLQNLIKAGIDINEAMENMCYDMDVFQHVLEKFLQDSNFKQLQMDIPKQNYESAFYHAHTLKGVLANIGMKDFCSICSNVVEKLRKSDYYGIDELIMRMSVCYDTLISAIQSYIKNE